MNFKSISIIYNFFQTKYANYFDFIYQKKQNNVINENSVLEKYTHIEKLSRFVIDEFISKILVGKKDENNKFIITDSKASLKTFNGNYPEKTEIKKLYFPEIDEAPPRYFFDSNPLFSKQKIMCKKNCL